MNLPTLLVSLVLAGIVGLIIYKMVKDKKQGKTSCSHGCQNCAMHGQCHKINN
ncbi:MAG: FeoB-associated Cys-rich membrane protein [Clostridia bacterium]|nr:FeoB-associated Cys-rich membrane protein [Clostridia bacterium]